jgi:hypothetical protein
MGAEPLIRPADRLYEEDFVEWARETARLLRSGRFDAMDVEHLAEEIEDMGISQEREALSRLRVLIVHLLKWRWQPEKRSRSWRSTIDVQRTEIEDVLRRSPSLRRSLSGLTVEAYPGAARRASIETGLSQNTFPAECPFSVAQILDPEFLP